MLKDITIGQFIRGDSIIHRADPRTKIALTFLYIISIFFINNIVLYVIPAIYLAIVIYFSKIPFKVFLGNLRPLRALLIITFILNIFFAAGDTILLSWRFIVITKEGLDLALHFSFRLVFLIIGSSILTLTTSPVSISDGIESFLKPLKKIKFPVHELAMMMTIALRFIPTLMEETDKIMKAQISRGADFDSGNIFEKAKSMIPLLVPLFISAFRRANDLAMAMEARCYHGDENRTRYRLLKFSLVDFYCILASILYFALIIYTSKL